MSLLDLILMFVGIFLCGVICSGPIFFLLGKRAVYREIEVKSDPIPQDVLELEFIGVDEWS